MSMIKCPECGKDVSDKATVCPECGYPIENVLKTIEEEKIKNQKLRTRKILLILVVIVGIISAISIIRSVINKPDKTGYYNGLVWGITHDKVKNKYPDITELNTWDDKGKSYGTTVTNLLNIKGVTADAAFSFEDDKLDGIMFVISNENLLKNNSIDDVVKIIYQKFNSAYGDGKNNNLGNMQLCEWTTAKSKITVVALEEYIAISYEDITLSSK